MQLAAHRGFHESLPENSLAAFEAAIEAGADAIEFDVRVTRDGVAVVTHWLECDLSVEGSAAICSSTVSASCGPHR
jgi:glycerophosphoryl diester phosphodiesterase